MALFSNSKWKWTWRFLLLACASVVVFAGLAYILSPAPDNGIAFMVGLACVAGLAVGIIGAAVTLVMTLRRRHSPPAKPVT
jgi:RsiW-degrading membrane proteinase PrsW (M82 family)